jgi:hypothetical protein
MKKYFVGTIAICFFFISHAQLKTPAPSPPQTIKQDFGLASIELSYSRPGVKGRKIFGDLVPFGKVWRTGANSATTLTFGDDVTIGGTKIPAGKYGLLTIPDKASWTIIITKQTDVTNPAAYKQESDVVRLSANVMPLQESTESFTMQFVNVKSTSCELKMVWDKSAVSFPIATEIDSKIMASIQESMKSAKPEYFQAAMYYMDNGKDLNQALDWFTKGADAEPDAYWIQHQRANCLAKLGRKEEAKKAAEKSKALASTAKNDDYVKLNEKLLAQLNK